MGYKVHVYLEYQSVCPLVRVGTLHPLSYKRVCPPQNQKGGTHSPADEGVGVPIRTTGEKAYHSVYYVPRILGYGILEYCSYIGIGYRYLEYLVPDIKNS
jgi:hypothetical protein